MATSLSTSVPFVPGWGRGLQNTGPIVCPDLKQLGCLGKWINKQLPAHCPEAPGEGWSPPGRGGEREQGPTEPGGSLDANLTCCGRGPGAGLWIFHCKVGMTSSLTGLLAGLEGVRLAKCSQ